MAYKLNLGLHETQLPVYVDNHRFKVINAGRQWGKSTFACRAGAGESLTKDKSVGMIVAPYADQAHKDYEDILNFIPPQYVKEVSARWLTITLKNGSKIMMRSGENIKGLRGFTLDWLIIDEAAQCDQEVWQVTEPELGKKKGKAWIISTPFGKGWFYDIFNRQEKDDEFQSFHFTTYDNPEFPVSEIERYKENMPELVFRQEIMAEFLEGGLVFPHLKDIMTSVPREPVPGHSYVTGADIAKYDDFTVLKTFDTIDNHEVAHERFTQRDWGFNRTAIYSHCKRYNNSTLIIDRTGAGDAVVEDLQKMDRAYPEAAPQGYLTIVPIVFSTVSKPLLYTNYIMMQQNRTIHLIDEPVTKREHEDFIGKLSQTTKGYMQFGAPKGRNDDTVVAAALGGWGLEKYYGRASLIGPFNGEPIKEKKPIDPSIQIDVDKIISENESRQIRGVYGDDDPNILPDYDER